MAPRSASTGLLRAREGDTPTIYRDPQGSVRIHSRWTIGLGLDGQLKTILGRRSCDGGVAEERRGIRPLIHQKCRRARRLLHTRKSSSTGSTIREDESLVLARSLLLAGNKGRVLEDNKSKEYKLFLIELI